MFTVLLPVHRPPWFLAHAVRSVLDQDLADFELCIICDGAPPETAQAAHDLARGDDRVHVFPFEKGQRHGEAHRAAVLEGARSRFVAQIGDDDLWYSDHLDTLAGLLKRADFAATTQVELTPDGNVTPADFKRLADPRVQARLLSDNPRNFVGPTVAGYRLAAYRTLPEGWSPAPEGMPTDLFMWRKFLRHPGIRLASSIAITSLKFPALVWKGHSRDLEADLIAHEAALLRDPRRRRDIRRVARRRMAQRLSRRHFLLQFPHAPGAILTLAWARLTAGRS